MSAYLLLQVDIADSEAYKAYATETPRIIQQYGGRFIVRGGDPEALEGELPASRVVLVEFDDRAAVQRFYRSPEYQRVLPFRQAASKGRVSVVDGA